MAAMTFSCTKEINENVLSTDKGTISVSVAGLMGEYIPETKSELVNTVRVAWKGGETVYVYDEASCLGTLTAALDDSKDDRYALLSGTIDAPDAGSTLFLVHSPQLGDEPEIDGGKLSISLAEQATYKAPFVVYATLDYSEGTIKDAIVPFSFATSVIRVSCTGLKPSTAISSAHVSGVNTSCVLSFADGTVTVSGAEEGIITRLDAEGFAKVNAEGDASFQLAVPALSSSSAGRTLTIMQGEDEYVDNKFSKASISPNLSVNTICSMVFMNNLIHGKFTVAEGKQVYFSKGNLQATYNGSSYSWGFASKQYDFIGSGNEAIASPVEGTILDLFGWSTGANDYGISTSRERDDYKGDFIDWGKALGSNVWRTLTADEWAYLVGTRTIQEGTGYGHTCTWATINEVEGLIIFCDDYDGFTDDLDRIPDGCVFLPAAGRRLGSEYTDEGYVYYWSASPSSPSQAKNLYFEEVKEPQESYSYMGMSTRNFGYSVRLVTDCN